VRRADVIPGVTLTVVVLNAAIYGLMVASGADPMTPNVEDLLAWGGNHAPLTLGGEWWRLVTAIFVHGGLMHLGFNMYVLWDLGRLVERAYGAPAFALVYLVAGIGGSFASVTLNTSAASVGASGAVFGVAGAFLAWLLRNCRRLDPRVSQHLRRSLLTFVAFNLVVGFSVPWIDNWAHIGGLATGLAGGFIVAPVIGPNGPERPYARYPLLALAGIAMCVLAAGGAPITALR
jgi:rhomboid protease GluP